MIKKILLVMLICNVTYGQNLEYTPVINVNIEYAFPVVAALLRENIRVGVEQIDWGKKTMISSYISYTKLLTPSRSRYKIYIDDNNTLHVQMFEPEWYDSSEKIWKKDYVQKKEMTFQAEFANLIRDALQKPELVKKCQDKFFVDLWINSRFFEYATDLAGKRWFENYLKDKLVIWKASFNDIKNNNDNNYKYIEIYSLTVKTLTTDITKFNIYKYTNSDKNTMTSKNTLIEFQGYCRSLIYKDDTFYIVLTDKLETPIPVNSVQEKETNGQKSILEYAEKLKELKNLLDQGIITKEEYESEKKKILDNKK